MEKDMNKNRTKNVLRNICISTVILFLGIILIFKSIKLEPEKKELLYSYNLNKNVNYEVQLNESEFFENNNLDMNKTYISSLVNKINMDFRYTLSGNKKSDTKYMYQVIAVTDVKYAGNSGDTEGTIWSKQDVLLEPKEAEISSSAINITDNFDIDFASYNEEVKKFKEEFRFPIKATLQIKLIIKCDMNVQGVDDAVVESSIMNVNMDLAQDVFSIEKEFKDSETKEIYKTTKASKNVNKPLLIIGTLLVIAAILIMLEAIRKSIKFSKRSDYAIALNRILKNYGDIVAEIVSPVEIDNLNIIEVKNFDQLLDIEEEIRMPILFYETIPNEQGEFIIICDNMAYRYVIG